MDCKNIKKGFFSQWLFEIIHISRFEMRMDSRINLKIFLGYDINYLMGDDHVTVFRLMGDVIHQQAENRQILVLRPTMTEFTTYS